MASSSTAKESSTSSSFDFPGIHWKYDVFLSFRGEDTRNNFTGNLYTALNDRGINTFIDDVRLERGKEISSELLEAIERSRVSIIVLSKNYASSTWCLEELEKIVECKDTKKEPNVFPVFYMVDPSDVRKQTGNFKTAFDKHEQDFKDNLEKVQRWRSALTKVGTLAGWHLQDRSEARFIKDVVDNILRSLNRTFSNVAGDLVGIESCVEEISKLLEPDQSNDICFIGICGMGGIGKTAIARVLFERLSDKYEGSCFLANVREVSAGRRGVVHLQEILLSKVLNETNLILCDDHEGINYIRRQLCHKRVFVVLDDVDDQLEQLEKLAGKHNWFGSGSRIIITTRDRHVLHSHGISSIYEVKGLKDDDALQLFHMKAFNNKQPKDDYVELSKQILSYAKGLPLALKVLGSYLCDRTVEQWKSALDSLHDYPDGKILKALRISYDGLKQNEKNIFLDIACFFKGKNKDRVMEILDGCNLYSTNGIKVLVDKSLITASYNKLGMHDLLQEMGWEIVREQHRDDRGKWSRLWLFEDVHHVLTENRGTHEVKGIMLNRPKQRISHLDGKSFSSMSNLRLLKISNVDISEDLIYLPNELRFIKWHGCPLKTLPSNFQVQKLFELNLCRSQITYLWKGMKAFEKLKTIKLSSSHNLIVTPDFTRVPNLEMLDLEGCTRLRKVHESLGFLKRLTVLNLKGCKNLESFPSNVWGLKLLKILNLQGCSKLDKLPENLGELECLEELDAGKTAIRLVPSSIGRLSNLKYLSFGERNKVQSWISLFLPRRYLDSMCLLLPPLSGLFSLKTLDISDCGLSDGALPNDLGSLCSLKELKLSNNNFASLPSISQLRKLKILCVQNCPRLQSLPELPPKTIFLGAEDCPLLEDVSSLLRGSISSNIALHFFNCPKLSQNRSQENNLAAVRLLKQYLQRPVNGSSQFHNCLPGSEIPEWFKCRSRENSVGIELPPNWFNDEFMGIAMCVVFSADPEDFDGITRMGCTMYIMEVEYYFCFNIPSLTTVDSDHLWLAYVSREKFVREYLFLLSLDNWQTKQPDSSCIHAEFGIENAENSNSKVIKCGIRPVYRKDTDQYFQESPESEGFIFHPNQYCSTLNGGAWCRFFMPTKLEYHSKIKGNYSGSGLDVPNKARGDYTDSDEE